MCALKVHEVTFVFVFVVGERLIRMPLDTQGGALVNLIHGYTDNGDPFVRHFTDQLLEEVRYSFWCLIQADSFPILGIQTLLRNSP